MQGDDVEESLACPVGSWRTLKHGSSESVHLARERGPQWVTVRGQDAIVVLSVHDHARLAPAAGTSLAALFGEGPFARSDGFDDALVRERSPRRETPDVAPDAR